MAADQVLITRDGEKHPRHTLKTMRDCSLNRKKKNETYIAIAQCLDSIPPYLVHIDQKETIDRVEWREWKRQNSFGKLSENDLWT